MAQNPTITQRKQPTPDEQVTVFQREVQMPDGQQLPDKTVMFITQEMSFDGKLVKGAPYSAQAVTETTQTFSDGNRIVNKSTATLYRDSEGRTRREQSLRAIGPFAPEGDTPMTIFISDPVAGVSYSLDPRTHEAHKMPPMRFQLKRTATPGAPQATGAPDAPTRMRSERVEIQPDVMIGGGAMALPRSPGAGGGVATGGSGIVMEWHGGEGKGKEEALGKQNIEGIEAEGTRDTMTIPAGEIGNERPIEIVSERWYSAELQTVVMTRHSDPRFGETVYRLTNINRGEPNKTLFEVPGDYTIKAVSGGGGMSFEMGAVMESTRTRTINGGVLNGKATVLPQPEYSAAARQARASGSVKVEVTIDEDGNVISAKAVFGHPLLQPAAVAAARQAKFTPTKLEGKPVQVSGSVVYEFVAQ
jgi:TonB family protein